MKQAGDYFALTPSGIRRCSLEEQVKASIRGSLLTRKGEIRGQGDLGSQLWTYLYRPLTNSLKQELEREIRSCLANSEPRITVERVAVQSAAKERNVFEIQIHYRIVGSDRADRLQVSLGDL